MADNSNCIKYTLFSRKRILIEYFMYDPSILRNRGSDYVNVNPVVYIRWINLDNPTGKYTNNTSYKVTPKNFFRVLDFINEVYKWFFDKDKYNMYFKDETGTLIFNAEYAKLSLTTLDKPEVTGQIMKATPALIVDKDDNKCEGIYLYINTLSQCIPLSIEELGEIHSIFRVFSFTDITTMLLLAKSYAMAHNNITTDPNAWKNRRSSTATVSNPFNI